MTAKDHVYIKMSDAKLYNSASKNRGTTQFNPSFNTPYDRIIHLQRTIGNRAVNRILKSGLLEAKLHVCEPNEKYEQKTIQTRQTYNTEYESSTMKANQPYSFNRSLHSHSRRGYLSCKSSLNDRLSALSLSSPVLNIQRQANKRDYSEDCSRYIGSGVNSCEFYNCREANNGNICGQRGYYIGYGLKYCKRFNLKTKKLLSPAGKKWIDKTTKCLQEYIHNNIAWDAPCKKVKKKAFDSHPRCYLKSGICSLPRSDWWHIVRTVDSSDFDLKQSVITGIGCLARWILPSKEGLRLVGRGLIEQGRMGLGKE